MSSLLYFFVCGWCLYWIKLLNIFQWYEFTVKQWSVREQPSNHDTSSQCLTNVGPPSTTWPKIRQTLARCVVFSGNSHDSPLALALTAPTDCRGALLRLVCGGWYGLYAGADTDRYARADTARMRGQIRIAMRGLIRLVCGGGYGLECGGWYGSYAGADTGHMRWLIRLVWGGEYGSFAGADTGRYVGADMGQTCVWSWAKAFLPHTI